MKLGDDTTNDYTSFTFKIPKFKLNFLLLILNLIMLGILIGSLISTTNLHIELSRIRNDISWKMNEVNNYKWLYEQLKQANWCYKNGFINNGTNIN